MTALLLSSKGMRIVSVPDNLPVLAIAESRKPILRFEDIAALDRPMREFVRVDEYTYIEREGV